MKVFIENPNLLINEFNELISISQRKAFITVGTEIQEKEIEVLSNYREQLVDLKKTFVERKLENEANLVYCIENSILAIELELTMLVNIKKDNMGEAWGNLVTAQVTYGTVIKNNLFDPEPSTTYLERLANYEKLLFPPQIFSSVGGIVKKSHCSICNESFSKCEHMKGKLYFGEICVRVISEMELEEASIVENPANKHCRMLKIDNIDTMTMRQVIDENE